MIPAETIREMLKSATQELPDDAPKEAWRAKQDKADELQMAAPDLAQTALELYARVSELEKEREACLKFCREQNGQEGCKNCGLGTGENWSINTPNECPIDGSCEACQ